MVGRSRRRGAGIRRYMKRAGGGRSGTQHPEDYSTIRAPSYAASSVSVNQKTADRPPAAEPDDQKAPDASRTSLGRHVRFRPSKSAASGKSCYKATSALMYSSFDEERAALPTVRGFFIAELDGETPLIADPEVPLKLGLPTAARWRTARGPSLNAWRTGGTRAVGYLRQRFR